jgi:hypothetical protein
MSERIVAVGTTMPVLMSPVSNLMKQKQFSSLNKGQSDAKINTASLAHLVRHPTLV